MNKDLLSGLVLLAIAALYSWAAGAIADSTLSDEVGASGLPRALTYALAGLGLLLIVRAVALARPVLKPMPDENAEEQARLARAVGFLLFGAVYVWALPYIGYLASVAVLIAAVALYEGAPRRWTVPVAAVGGAVLYWMIFVKLLGVKQPLGTIWQGLFS